MIVLVFLILTGNAVSQVNYGEPPSISSRLVYQTWSVKSTSGAEYDLVQWYFPVYGYLPIAENWEIHVTTASAGTDSVSSVNEVSITGFRDTRISALHSLFDKSLLVGIGLNLPTGKTKLDPEQTALGRLLTAEFLDLPSKRYGEGFGVYFEGAFARRVYGFLTGAAIGYLVSTSYSPVSDIDDYNAGNKLTISGNLMRNHSYGRAYVYIRHSIYGTSAQNGFDVHKTGSITELAGGSSVEIDKFEANGGLRLLLRRADSRLVSNALGLREFEQNNYGSDFRFFSSLGYRMEDIGKASILIDYKKVAANGFEPGDEEYLGESSLYGIGVQFERVIGGRYMLGASVKAHSGSADDDNLDLSGYEVSLMARAAL
jgi:hypothetical protein